jgi:hypothetical protein
MHCCTWNLEEVSRSSLPSCSLFHLVYDYLDSVSLSSSLRLLRMFLLLSIAHSRSASGQVLRIFDLLFDLIHWLSVDTKQVMRSIDTPRFPHCSRS